MERHRQSHWGQQLHQPPLFDVEPKLQPVCLLHLLLRLVAALWANTISGYLSEAIETDLLAFLKKINVHIPKRKLKKLGKNWETLDKQRAQRKYNFNGAACLNLLSNFPELLSIVLVGEDKKKSDRFYCVWQLCVNFWCCLTTWPDHADPVAQRAEISKEVRTKSHLFVRVYTYLFSKGRSLYLHYMIAHVHEDVIEFGDLRCCSGQGLEHLHSEWKALLFSNTNRQPGQRLGQLVEHYQIKRKLVQKEGGEKKKSDMVVAKRAVASMKRKTEKGMIMQEDLVTIEIDSVVGAIEADLELQLKTVQQAQEAAQSANSEAESPAQSEVLSSREAPAPTLATLAQNSLNNIQFKKGKNKRKKR